jgi:hypothetical protein
VKAAPNDYLENLKRYRDLGQQLAVARDLGSAERIAEEIARHVRRPPPADVRGGPAAPRPQQGGDVTSVQRRSEICTCQAYGPAGSRHQKGCPMYLELLR